jgi:hypothetical protein
MQAEAIPDRHHDACRSNEPRVTPTTCYAYADRLRAAVALLFPAGAVAVTCFALFSKGYSPLDIPALVRAGELSWPSQALSWSALVFWLIRYYPPAWQALVDGPCLVIGDEQSLFFPGPRRIARDQILAVRVQRDLLRKLARFETADGRTLRLSLLFVRRDCDALLRSLAPAPS